MSLFCGGKKSDRLADVYMKRANLNEKDLSPPKVAGRTALHNAVLQGEIKKVKSLIKDIGQIVNAQDANLDTALHLSSSRDIALVLLSGGADTRITNKFLMTAFHHAAARGHIEVLEAFYDYGKISIHLRVRPLFNTALHDAAGCNQFEASKSLLEYGAEPNITNASGLSPLHLAVEKNNFDITELLLQHGARIDLTVPNKPGEQQQVQEVAWKYPTGSQAIHVAAIRCSDTMITFLVERGADLNARGAYQLTPLHISLMRRNFETAHRLLIEGADVNAKTSIGDTALHIAVSVQNSKILRALLEYGARRKEVNRDGFTALHTASVKGWARGVEILSAFGADTSMRSAADGYTALNLAASTGSLGAVEALLENQATVNATNTDGRTPLHIAVEKGNCRVARTLLQHGAAVNVCDPDTNESVLHVAARYCRLDIVNALLIRGAYVDALTARDETALHVLAAAPAHTAKPETADLLLRRGCHLEVRDKVKRSALYIAMKQRDQALCLMLLAHGADVASVPRSKSPSITALFFRGDEDWGDRFAYALISSGCDLKHLHCEMHAFTNQKANARGLTLALDLVMWVYERLVAPLPLLQLCRREIRKQLQTVSAGMSLLHDIRRLPIRNGYKEYLLLSDCGITIPLELDAATADARWSYKDGTMKRKKTSKLKFLPAAT